MSLADCNQAARELHARVAGRHLVHLGHFVIAHAYRLESTGILPELPDSTPYHLREPIRHAIRRMARAIATGQDADRAVDDLAQSAVTDIGKHIRPEGMKQ